MMTKSLTLPTPYASLPKQQRLYFLPLPQGQGALRLTGFPSLRSGASRRGGYSSSSPSSSSSSSSSWREARACEISSPILPTYPSKKARIAPSATRVVIRAPWKVVMGNRRPNTLPTSNMAAESANMTRTTRITRTATTRRYPIHVPSWAAQQDLSGSLPAGCITTRAPPRGNGERPSSGWSPCRRRWALPHHSCGPGRTPRQPTLPQSGIDVHNQQRPPVETVAKVVGHGYPLGSKEVHRTCHRRCQRSPHIDQWFDKSP